jgi:TadE-like protein
MALAPANRNRVRKPHGQTLAEFAIVFPVMFLIIAGIIQFGLIFWAQNTLTQVVRDTGRWAATQQSRPCDSGGAALVSKADVIARTSSLFGYSTGQWTLINGGAPFAFDLSPAPPEGIEASWPISTDPPGGFFNTDCPPATNEIAWFVNIRAHHEIPLFIPFIGQFLPSCDVDSCSLSSSVQFRMEPSR